MSLTICTIVKERSSISEVPRTARLETTAWFEHNNDLPCHIGLRSLAQLDPTTATSRPDASRICGPRDGQNGGLEQQDLQVCVSSEQQEKEESRTAANNWTSHSLGWIRCSSCLWSPYAHRRLAADWWSPGCQQSSCHHSGARSQQPAEQAGVSICTLAAWYLAVSLTLRRGKQ